MRWRCAVCNYVHEGDEPPDECPVCKAPRDVFVPVEDEPDAEEPPPSEEPPSKEPPPEEDKPASTRRWRCTVCNYIHEGDAPPDVCPVCQQPWTKFVPETGDGAEGEGGDRGGRAFRRDWTDSTTPRRTGRSLALHRV